MTLFEYNENIRDVVFGLLSKDESLRINDNALIAQVIRLKVKNQRMPLYLFLEMFENYLINTESIVRYRRLHEKSNSDLYPEWLREKRKENEKLVREKARNKEL